MSGNRMGWLVRTILAGAMLLAGVAPYIAGTEESKPAAASTPTSAQSLPEKHLGLSPVVESSEQKGSIPLAPDGFRKGTKRDFGEPAVYKRIDGRELRILLVKPADWKESDRRPAIVFFHGGGWQGGSVRQFEEHSKYLAARGMVCVNVEYRLLEPKTKTPPIVCIQDAKSALRWTRSNAATLGIDPQRIAAGGGSAGGHLAAFVGLMEGMDDPQDDLAVSPRPDALVLFNPVIDNSREGYGHDRVGDRLKEFSPAHHVTPTAPPTIIFVGSLDTAIRPAAVERFRDEMTKAGVRCEARIYEGQSHGFFNYDPQKPRFYQETMRETDLFLTSLGWLSAEPAPPPATTSLNATETDSRLHSDGKGWRLQQARATDAARPRVLLIGDSILNGYLQEVSTALDGKAYVDAWVTPTNQADKQLPRMIEEVLAHGPYRVIHFNLGLHGWQPGRIPAEQFEPLTRQLVQSLRKHAPQAALIWASTTPVTKQGLPGELEPEINPVIVEHNRLAAEVMAREKVAVDDLYSLMLPKLGLARGDKYHWTPEARSLQAQAVAGAILTALAEPPRESPDETRETSATKPSVAPFQDGDVVCFVGDSITRGGWFHRNILLYYATRFPDRKLRFFNCGHSGDSAPGLLTRLSWDVLEHQPKAAVVMLGMNDVGISADVEKPAENLAKIVVALQQAGCRVTLVGPTIYEEAAQLESKPNIGKNAALGAFAKRVSVLAEEKGTGFVDFHGPMHEINQSRQKDDPAFTLVGPDRVHPGEVGHLVMAHAFLKSQGMPQDVSRIVLDAAQPTVVEQINCTVDGLKTTDNGLEFTCLERSLPFAVPEKARPALELIPFTNELNRETLVVRNLPAGDYTLQIDDQPVGELTAEKLSAGIELGDNAKTPQHQQAERVAKANDRRHDVESVSLRGVSFVRYRVLDKAGIDPSDTAAVDKHLREYLVANAGKPGFGRTMVERYLSTWGPKNSDNLALINSLTETMRKESQPISHRWRLTRK